MQTLAYSLTMTTEPYCDHSAASLRKAWQHLQAAEPSLRIRDAAARLDVSEVELLALDCGRSVTRLEADWPAFSGRLHTLGRVMALTRNDLAVHESYGIYPAPAQTDVPTEELLTLRLWPERWRFGFAVTELGRTGERRSLQFFDAEGVAVHKIYLTEDSLPAAYDELVRRHRSADQAPWQDLDDPPARSVERKEWQRVADAHGFHYLLLRRKPLSMNLPTGVTRQVGNDAAERVLTTAAEQRIALRIEVANHAAEQVFAGRIENVRRTGPWINVLDEGFNLHLKDTALAASRVVLETHSEGEVSRLELLDGQANIVACLSAANGPDASAIAIWRDLLAAFPTVEGWR